MYLNNLHGHSIGNWGNELCDEDRESNDQALSRGDEILSAYKSESGTKFLIITEADRSIITVILPEEY